MVHRHPSIRALLDAEGCNDPYDAIRRRARALVAEALEIGWEGPPFDMSELASLRRLQVSTSTAFGDDQDACVMPGRILVNARKPPVRQRYSVAHEVGHTLFPDYEKELQRVGRLWRREGDDSELERLCQTAGAEFLMPLDTFVARVNSYGIGIEAVLRLAREFMTSIEAAARRRVETSATPMALLFLRPWDPKTREWLNGGESDGHSPFTPIAVTRAYAKDHGSRFRVAEGTLPPKGSAAERAWKRVALARGAIVIEGRAQECWEHASVPGLWISEAITLPKGAAVPQEVLCMLREHVT